MAIARRFVTGLRDAGAAGDHEGLLRQRGMFSLLPLGTERVARLRDEFAIYVVGSGRINVAGLTERQPRRSARPWPPSSRSPCDVPGAVRPELGRAAAELVRGDEAPTGRPSLGSPVRSG